MRVSLLKCIEVAIPQSLRRRQQLFCEATPSVRTARERSDSVARQQAQLARDLPRNSAEPFQARCLEADQRLTKVVDAPHKRLASEVRKALWTDHQRLKASLGALQSLEFGGRANDPAFDRFAAWHDLVRDVDPHFGLHAFAACTMMSPRQSLRNGRV